MNGGNNPGQFVAKAATSVTSTATSAAAELECHPVEQAKRDALNLGKDDLSANGLYRVLTAPLPQSAAPRQYFEPIKPGQTEAQHLRTANNIVIALLGPLGAPSVLTRSLGFGEDAVSAVNSTIAAFLSVLGTSRLARRFAHPESDLRATPTTYVTPKTPTSLGLKIVASGRQLAYQPSSGVQLRSDPARITTVLGSYAKDMRHVVQELGNIKSTDLGPRLGGFNVLNVPDELYVSPRQFWQEYNKPWLNNVMTRNDKVLMATKPRFEPETAPDGRRYSVLTTTDNETGKVKLSGFGREYVTLRRSGYRYENGEMKK